MKTIPLQVRGANAPAPRSDDAARDVGVRNPGLPQGLRRNVASAAAQVGASLILAAMGVATFKLLDPTGMAYFRHMYFTPFTISIGPCMASHDYIRSLLFGEPPSETRKAEMRSLMIVNSVGSLAILAVVFGMLGIEERRLPAIEAVTVTIAVFVYALRFVLLGRLEVTSRYALAVVMANFSMLLPYLAVVVYWLAKSQIMFFGGIVLLNGALALLMLWQLRCYSSDVDWRGFLNARPLFPFSFRKYRSLAMIALGTVLSSQGVEFFFYTITRYGVAQIANYALAYTIAAMTRQLTNTFLQPLQAREVTSSVVTIAGRPFSLGAVAETIIVTGLVAAGLVMPTIFAYVFPKYETARGLIAPLLFGVMGTSTLQLYSVQLVARSRVGYLAWSHVVVSAVLLLGVWILNGALDLFWMSIFVSAVLWLRGVVVTPLFARQFGMRTSPKVWAVRFVGSAALLGLAMAGDHLQVSAMVSH